MRLIAQCQQCQRQYNATGKQPGKRFRCQCGSTVTVPQPQGHDASVVRCSSCAAPRQEQAPFCRHCGSDYTLHERDLHTICPNCLARVSDRARYCHHCAHLLASQSLQTTETEHTCPVCGEGKNLVDRELAAGLPHVLECNACTGMWLSMESVEQLVDAEATRSVVERGIAPTSAQVIEVGPQTGPAYRPCAVCHSLMMRRNFGRGQSNVIVDICRVHGIWFDANELAALLRWMRAGGLPAAQAELARINCDPVQKLRDRSASEPATKTSQRSSSDSGGSFFPSEPQNVSDVAIGLLLSLFDL